MIFISGLPEQFLKIFLGQTPRTQVPNLFYGSKSVEGILTITDKFIPSEKIDEALKVFHSLPKEEKGDRFDVTEALENITIEEDGIDFEKLLARSVSDILEGKPVDDRSLAVTRAVKEILGWTNWLRKTESRVESRP